MDLHALWGARQSAKLNVFLGVLNLDEQFVPPHLATCAASWRPADEPAVPVLRHRRHRARDHPACRPPCAGVTPVHAAGLTFVITMLSLAVLEHWFLVLPLPFARLWSWALTLRSRPSLRQRAPGPRAGRTCGTRPGRKGRRGHGLRAILPQAGRRACGWTATTACSPTCSAAPALPARHAFRGRWRRSRSPSGAPTTTSAWGSTRPCWPRCTRRWTAAAPAPAARATSPAPTTTTCCWRRSWPTCTGPKRRCCSSPATCPTGRR